MPGEPGALFSARKRAKFLFRSSYVSGVRFFLGIVIAEISVFSLHAYLSAKPMFLYVNTF